MKLLFMLVLVGCLPPDKTAPPPPPAPGTLEAQAFAHPWLVENHILAGNATLTEGDAILMHGRKVEVTTSTYRSPFQGSCDDAAYTQRTRSFDDVAAEVDLAGDRRTTAANFGIAKTVTEYTMQCRANTRTPPLVLFVSEKRGMTCFSGVCYLLTPA